MSDEKCSTSVTRMDGSYGAHMTTLIRELDTLIHQMWVRVQDGTPLDDLLQQSSLTLHCIGSTWHKQLLPLLEREKLL